MLNPKFCVPLESLVNKLSDSMSTTDLAEATIQIQLSRTIRNARKKENITQSEFARRLGVTQSLVSRWESGDCNFTIHTLATIGEILNLTLRSPLIPSHNEQCVKLGFEFEKDSVSADESYPNLDGICLEVAA